MGYAFISYSSKERAMADAMRQLLIDSGISTWMAPWDISGGENYLTAIRGAIYNCSCMVLMLSREAQKSVWVPKEVERALTDRKVIVPVQIDDGELTDEFEMCISTAHVIKIDKIDGTIPEIQMMLKYVKELCETDNELQDQQSISPEDEFDAWSFYERATELYDQEQYAEAVKWYFRAAELDYDKAMLAIGRCYFYGRGVEEDDERAMEWIGKAVERENGIAWGQAGFDFYLEDEYALALMCYCEMVKQGDPEGMFWIGLCYLRGHGIEQNIEEALNWFRKAAAQGYENAQIELGECYCYGYGDKADYDRAVKLLRDRIAQGDKFAELRLEKLEALIMS